MFFSEKRFYERKESSVPKYYSIRSKMTVFKKNFMFRFKNRICLSTSRPFQEWHAIAHACIYTHAKAFSSVINRTRKTNF